jgi:hypothetical protein
MGGETSKSSTKVDKQELFDELHRRAEAEQPFTPIELAGAMGITETLAARHLLLLSADGFVERLDGGKYSAAAMKEIGLGPFLKELQAAAKNPSREKDLQDIARLKSNNDIMRERLLQAHAERDRYLALLRKHGVDPQEDPGIGATAAPHPVAADAPTVPITVGSRDAAEAPAADAAPAVASTDPAIP